MHASKYYVKGTIVQMHKKPWQAVVCVMIEKKEILFSIKDNQIELIAGEINPELLPGVTALIAQYFLPVQEIKRKRPE
jgi:hypothetical protein